MKRRTGTKEEIFGTPRMKQAVEGLSAGRCIMCGQPLTGADKYERGAGVHRGCLSQKARRRW